LRAVVGGGVHQRQQFWLQAIFYGANFVAAMRIAGLEACMLYFLHFALQNGRLKNRTQG